ncbi:coiled-coil and C2 domain-containing protein 2A [Ixodes scapularis]|uniref:coiled-coil and C2 domain-containing protein 2A n=1 Tax=Ixodes scapularis TaxID=6945 RepID=UPI001A9F0A6E|nr:coiled-coil and C2 domain-containing protein 2A [Ixodes scapularis]
MPRGLVVNGNGRKSRSVSILDRSKLRVIAQGGAGDSRRSIDVPTEFSDPKEERLEFCDEAELERNPRFRLLRLRDSGSAEFRNFGAVPLLLNEYSVSLIEKIYAREPCDEKLPSHRDPIEDRQVKRAHLMKQMREEVIRKVYESQTHRVLEDIIIEEKVPIIGSLGFGLFKLVKKHRPLRPSRKERRKVTGQSVAAADAEILVTVLRATNVPVRKDGQLTKGVAEDVIECQVRPFVEVMFQRKTARTFVAEGPHPTWNQELRLPLTMGDSDGPCSVRDIIYLNLFDEVVLDLLEDDRERLSTVHQRLERRWLGNLKVPFSTLYLNSKIEGTFRLDTPPVLLGYVHEVKPWALIHDAPSMCTYISFYLTIEPGLQPPEVLRACCESTEPSQLVQSAEEWQSALHTQHPQRFVKALAMDASGKWVFVPRFLRPLAPPEELSVLAARRASSIMEGPPPKDVMSLVARFVSLIPTLSDSVFFPGLCDIWSTCDQFLQVLVGDEEEHAILLCNFFLHLGKEAYLLLGTGIPEGQTAYVLTREGHSGGVSIWNAVTGKRYSATDSYGPLQNIGCLVGRDNIWANVQKHEHPSRLSYNLSKANHWKPFFPKGKHQTELDSVQPSELVYEATDPSYVEQLQQKIEYVLKESIMNWRKRFRTSWNRYASQVLRKILPRLESMAASLSSTDDIQELSEILATYKMSGFPLSMSFTDVDTVIENVLSTGVHLTEAKNAEFALAVHIHPYPSNVLAVWVYVAVLSRKF